jgi:hypothetical protein
MKSGMALGRLCAASERELSVQFLQQVDQTKPTWRGAQPGNLGTFVAGNYGHLTLNADGSSSYAANSGGAGGKVDTFAYTARRWRRAGTSSDTIWMRASNGLRYGARSNGVTVTDTPVADPISSSVIGSSGQTFAATSLFTASDADGDTLTQFDFWDTGGGGGRWMRYPWTRLSGCLQPRFHRTLATTCNIRVGNVCLLRRTGR